jgi:hypothetical protein
MDHIPDQHRALRARLMELTGAVKAYFEATAAVSVGAGYWGAFDALRKNQALAQSFVGDLQALLDHLEREVIPVLSSSKQAAPPAPPPVQAQAAQTQPQGQTSINEEATMLLNRLPESVQKEAMRLSKELESARSAPQTPPSVVVDDGDDSLIQEVMTDPEIDLPAQRPPAQSPQAKAQPPSQPKPPPAAKPAAPAAKPADQEAKSAPAARPLPGLTKGSSSPAATSSRPASGGAKPQKAAEPHRDSAAKESARQPAKDGAKKDAPRPTLQGQGAIAARIAAVAAAAKASAAQAGQPSQSTPPGKTAERPPEKSPERSIERQASGKLLGTPAARPQASPVSPSSGIIKGAARPLGSRTMQQPTPQFDETDVTSPGFTLEPGEDPHPAKRR